MDIFIKLKVPDDFELVWPGNDIGEARELLHRIKGIIVDKTGELTGLGMADCLDVDSKKAEILDEIIEKCDLSDEDDDERELDFNMLDGMESKITSKLEEVDKMYDEM